MTRLDNFRALNLSNLAVIFITLILSNLAVSFRTNLATASVWRGLCFSSNNIGLSWNIFSNPLEGLKKLQDKLQKHGAPLALGQLPPLLGVHCECGGAEKEDFSIIAFIASFLSLLDAHSMIGGGGTGVFQLLQISSLECSMTQS